MSVNKSGPLRIIRKPNGYYVTGRGVLIHVESYSEGAAIIEYLNVGQYTTRARKEDQ